MTPLEAALRAKASKLHPHVVAAVEAFTRPICANPAFESPAERREQFLNIRAIFTLAALSVGRLIEQLDTPPPRARRRRHLRAVKG